MATDLNVILRTTGLSGTVLALRFGRDLTVTAAREAAPIMTERHLCPIPKPQDDRNDPNERWELAWQNEDADVKNVLRRRQLSRTLGPRGPQVSL